MRIRRMLRRIMMPGRYQDGFSIIEILFAGLLLMVVSAPLMQLFGTSINIANQAADLNKASVCLRNFTENIWGVPFYRPYNSSDGNVDMDDNYWEGAVGSRGLGNSWSTAPDIEDKAYGVNPYPQFRITVKMVFLNDDMTEASLWSYWGPRGKESGYNTANTDDPRDYKNQPINLIKFEVKIHYKVDGVETADSYNSVTAIMTRSQAQANLGITECIVTDADLRGSTENSAPHTLNHVPIQISGYGFSSECTAFLQMQAHSDIEVKGLDLSKVQDGIITGYLDLSTAETYATKPWFPYAEPGGWEVVVKKGTPYAVLYEGFVVEFPKPEVYSAVAPSPFQDKGSNGDASIKVSGNPILAWPGASFSTYPSYPRATAAMQLVWRNPDGSEDRGRIISDRYLTDELTNMSSTVTGNNYTGGDNSDTITDRLSLRGRSDWGYPYMETVGSETFYYQYYYVEVWNCKDQDLLGQKGDRAGSSADPRGSIDAFYIKVQKAPFGVYSIFDTDVYNGTDPHAYRNWGFTNRTYNLTLQGDGLDVVDPANGIRAYIGKYDVPMPVKPSDPEELEDWVPYNGTVPANVQQGVIQSVENYKITATFDLTRFSALASNTKCWLYVYNTETYEVSIIEVSADQSMYAYIVRQKPTITTGPINSATSANSGWYYNYYDLTAQFTGTGFMATDVIYYQKSDGTGTRYQVGVNDGNETKTWTSETSMKGQLNLIGLPNQTWKTWIQDPYEETYGGSPQYVSATFTSTYGPPRLLDDDNTSPYSPSSVIVNERHEYAAGFLDVRWTSWDSSAAARTEGAARASAYNETTGPWYVFGATLHSYAQLKLKGMGFIDSSTGSATGTTVYIGMTSNAKTSTIPPGASEQKQSCLANINRSAKTVEVITGNQFNTGTANTYGYFTMYKSGGTTNFRLYLDNTASYGGNKNYADRWSLVNP